MFKFEITFQSAHSKARLGRLTTPHGVVETPAFIFCATKAAIKGATAFDMKREKTQIILSNTYHLMLQPGPDIVEKMGGLHRFMGWDGPMLTDSGGFQIFSLGHGSVAEEVKRRSTSSRPKSLVKITEEGATFKSYLDGKQHTLSPEKSIQVQRALGADLIVVLDECTPFHVDKAYTERSMHLSHRWGERSLAEFNKGPEIQALYGITQGGVYPDLRRASADFINSLPFFGHAVGGSLGENKSQMKEVVEMAMEPLDPTRPVQHLLGIGGISDILHGVTQGIDTFNCVHPTRLARPERALVPPTLAEEGREHLNLRNNSVSER